MKPFRSTNHRALQVGLAWLATVVLASVLTSVLSGMASSANNVTLLTTLTAVASLLLVLLWLVFFQMRELKRRKKRLKSLYALSNFLADTSPETLFSGVNALVRDLMQADAIGLRLYSRGETSFSMLFTEQAGPLAKAEQILAAAADALAALMADRPAQQVALNKNSPESLHPCIGYGVRSLVYIPLRSEQQLLAEIVIFYQRELVLGEDRNELINAITRHLAIALEHHRARALDRESAVSAERHFIARELHDSIAQSLGFLKIQIHLMRKAIEKCDQDMASFVLAELDAGLANSIADVRELLVHFRTRTDSGEIETAVQETLQKFQNQSGLKAYFESSGVSTELAPDVQIQVLNVLQESLSNIRKHAQASRVDVKLVRGQIWQLSVRDDGKGFDTSGDKSLFHVGLNIMHERAELISAKLAVESSEGSGTTVTLQVPLHSTLRSVLPAAATSTAPVANEVPTSTNEYPILATQKT